MKVLHPVQERVDPAIQQSIDKIIRSNPQIDLVGLARQIGAAFSSADIMDNMTDHDKLRLAQRCGDMFEIGFKAVL
jgi:hypothetical protein